MKRTVYTAIAVFIIVFFCLFTWKALRGDYNESEDSSSFSGWDGNNEYAGYNTTAVTEPVVTETTSIWDYIRDTQGGSAVTTAPFTDADGNIYENVYGLVATDANGNDVTDANGNVVTEYCVAFVTDIAGEVVTDPSGNPQTEILGYLIVDENGSPILDASGNLQFNSRVTTAVNTSVPTTSTTTYTFTVVIGE